MVLCGYARPEKVTRRCGFPPPTVGEGVGEDGGASEEAATEETAEEEEMSEEDGAEEAGAEDDASEEEAGAEEEDESVYVTVNDGQLAAVPFSFVPKSTCLLVPLVLEDQIMRQP